MITMIIKTSIAMPIIILITAMMEMIMITKTIITMTIIIPIMIVATTILL